MKGEAGQGDQCLPDAFVHPWITEQILVSPLSNYKLPGGNPEAVFKTIPVFSSLTLMANSLENSCVFSNLLMLKSIYFLPF